MKFTLSSGRDVHATRVLVTETYEGFLEGHPEAISKRLRERIRADIERAFWKCEHILIIDDGAPTLPKYRVLSYLKSLSPVRAGHYSELMICWFTDDVTGSLDTLLASRVSDKVWNENARDFAWADL